MLRRVSVDKMSVTQVSDEYGVTRPTFYQAKADFEGAGIVGLVPRKRGPRGPHKIQSEVLAFLKAQVSPGEPIRARELTNLVRGEFGLDVHPGTIERALGVQNDVTGGGDCITGCSPVPRQSNRVCFAQPRLARRCLGRRAPAYDPLHRGMWAWVRASLPGAARQPFASVLPPVTFRSRTKFLNNARSSTCSPQWFWPS